MVIGDENEDSYNFYHSSIQLLSIQNCYSFTIDLPSLETVTLGYDSFHDDQDSHFDSII